MFILGVRVRLPGIVMRGSYTHRLCTMDLLFSIIRERKGGDINVSGGTYYPTGAGAEDASEFGLIPDANDIPDETRLAAGKVLVSLLLDEEITEEQASQSAKPFVG